MSPCSKRDQDLVVDLRHPDDAGVRPGARRRDPAPTHDSASSPSHGNLTLTRPMLVGVVVVGHDPDHDAVDRGRRPAPPPWRQRARAASGPGGRRTRATSGRRRRRTRGASREITHLPASAGSTPRHAHRDAGLEVGRARARRPSPRTPRCRPGSARGVRQLVGGLLRADAVDRRRPASGRRPSRRGPPASWAGRRSSRSPAAVADDVSFFAPGPSRGPRPCSTCADGAHPGAELEQVVAPDERPSASVPSASPSAGSGRRLDGLLEQQVLAVDPAVEADLGAPGRTGSRGRTGWPGTRGRGCPRTSSTSGVSPAPLGELLGDVRVLHVQEGLRSCGPRPAGATVVAADDGARAAARRTRPRSR